MQTKWTRKWWCLCGLCVWKWMGFGMWWTFNWNGIVLVENWPTLRRNHQVSSIRYIWKLIFELNNREVYCTVLKHQTKYRIKFRANRLISLRLHFMNWNCNSFESMYSVWFSELMDRWSFMTTLRHTHTDKQICFCKNYLPFCRVEHLKHEVFRIQFLIYLIWFFGNLWKFSITFGTRKWSAMKTFSRCQNDK